MTEGNAEQLGLRVHQADDDPLGSIFNVPFTFQRRPTPLAAELRILWRVPMVTLLLRLCCKGRRSSVRRLQVLGWAVRTKRGRRILLGALQGATRRSDVIIRTDPSLMQAIDFAIGERLLDIVKNGGVVLTQKGSQMADEILLDKECFLEEMSFLRELGIRITESFVESLLFVGATTRSTP